MSDETDCTIVSVTAIITPDPLAALSDDERRIVLAWRSTRGKARSGVAALTVILWTGQMLIFDGLPAGKVLIR